MQTKIIYEDEEILIIQKPAGLATQAKGVGQKDVVSELKSYLHKTTGKTPYVGIVHRLDQPVEGLLVFGKNQVATAKLSQELKNGQLNKKYYAVICGQPNKTQGRLVDDMYKSKDNVAVIVEKGDSISSKDKTMTEFGTNTKKEPKTNTETEVKKASLIYDILYKEDTYAIADVILQTGRFHQIRAQFSHAGFPLLGDRKYGTEESLELSQKLHVKNVALCAYEINVKHPKTGKDLCFRIKPEGKIFANILTE